MEDSQFWDGLAGNIFMSSVRLSALAFYERCSRRLADGGIWVANLQQTVPRVERILRSLARAFDGNCLIGQAADWLDRIVVAQKSRRVLKDDNQTDVRRLMVKAANEVSIPYLEPLQSYR